MFAGNVSLGGRLVLCVGSTHPNCVAEILTQVAQFTQKPVYNVLFLGFQGSGKTWLLEQLKHTYLNGRMPSDRIAPTIGQNVLDLPYNKSILHFWDLGGAVTMRKLWSQYVPDAHTIVWVLDAQLWVDDASVDGEAAPTYRAAVLATLFPIAKDAAARRQSIVVLINKTDTLDPEHPDEGARPSQIAEHVESHILKQWASIMDKEAPANISTPLWSFQSVSAAEAYVVYDATYPAAQALTMRLRPFSGLLRRAKIRQEARCSNTTYIPI